jgi:hypothetical protein
MKEDLDNGQLSGGLCLASSEMKIAAIARPNRWWLFEGHNIPGVLPERRWMDYGVTE